MQMLLTHCPIEEGMNWDIGLDSSLHSKSIATNLILRGNGANSLETTSLANKLFSDNRVSVPWLEKSHYNCISSEKSFCGKYPVSAALLSNSSLPLKTRENQVLHNIYNRAGGLFSQGAFVHQYERYGLTTQEMLSSFAAYKTIINSYGLLKKWSMQNDKFADGIIFQQSVAIEFIFLETENITMTERQLSFAVVCSSNMNRSMEAHRILKKKEYRQDDDFCFQNCLFLASNFNQILSL